MRRPGAGKSSASDKETTSGPLRRVSIVRSAISLLLLLFSLAKTPGAFAAVLVDNRSTLQDLLGTSAVTEDFERFQLGGAPVLDLPTELDSSTVLPGQAPGLVVDGVKFDGQGHFLQIQDLSFLGSSQALDDGGTLERTLLVDFSNPIRAFGFDFLPSALSGENIDLTILGTDDSTVLNTFSLPVFFFPTFVGAADMNGIGLLKITSHINPPFNDIRIDNLTFGVGLIPEPSTGVLLLFGGVWLFLFRSVRSKLR